MENPARQTMRAMGFVILGIMIGFVPGVIRVDQLRREVNATTMDTANKITELKHTIAERDDLSAKQVAAEKTECGRVILGDGAHTILVDQNHPYGGYQQNVMGISVMFPPIGNRALPVGPIWIVPRAITPTVMEGMQGGAYTHIWPDGRTDGWHAARGPQ